jgi:RNase P/RNase MRP subunit POP5
MRRGQRYLLLKTSGFSGTLEETERALRTEMEKILGRAGLGKAGYKFVRPRENGRLGNGDTHIIIKGSISGIITIRAALTLLSSLNGKKAKVEVLRASGTIKGALKEKSR